VNHQVFKYLLFTLIISTIFISCDELDYRYEVRVQNIHLDSLAQIIQIKDSIVTPVLYDTLLIDNLSTISEKKQQFINQILPAILIVKFKEQQKYDRIKNLLSRISQKEELIKKDQLFLDSLVIRYNANSYENLPERLKPHPTSLVLAQAAVESGWGQSRFALEGNNLFGIRATNYDKESQKSLYNRGGNRISVKRYNTVSESIEHYFFTIGKNQAYRSFRLKRFEEANIYQLIDELHKYSETGDEYSRMLKQIIIWNDLMKYDICKIDENFVADRKCLCYLTKKMLEKISL
jgi:Bax protein